jgi:hypothetical protein
MFQWIILQKTEVFITISCLPIPHLFASMCFGGKVDLQQAGSKHLRIDSGDIPAEQK